MREITKEPVKRLVFKCENGDCQVRYPRAIRQLYAVKDELSGYGFRYICKKCIRRSQMNERQHAADDVKDFMGRRAWRDPRNFAIYKLK